MPRKSKLRTMLTGRWVRWFLVSSLARAFPPFGRAFNFPLRRIAARKVAARIFDDHEEFVSFATSTELYERVVTPSAANDAGETWRYPSRKTIAYRFCGVVEDCDVNTTDMRVVHRPTFSVVDFWESDVPASLIKPTRLTRQAARPEALYFCAASTSNYYHFLMDHILPLIAALRRFGDAIGPLVVLVQREAPKFAHDILAALAARFPAVSVETVPGGRRLEKARALFVSRFAQAREWAPFDREDVDILRDALIAHYGLPPARAERDVYVSRRGARLRALTGEDELIGALEQRGFTVFAPRADNHAEQVRTFGSARLVVAVHGAALTNLLFCPPGATLVELFARDHIKSPYLWIASRLGLRYVPVFGSDSDFRQGFTLLPSEVVAAVEGLGARGAAAFPPPAATR